MKSGAGWAKRFEKACRKWQITLGLTDWCFYYRSMRNEPNVAATVTPDCEGRNAVLRASLDCEQDDTPERIGLHETLHVLFADLLHVAALRGCPEHDDVRREEHRVIERLLNVIDGIP